MAGRRFLLALLAGGLLAAALAPGAAAVSTTGMWRLTARFGGTSSLRPSASPRGSFHAGHF